MVSIGALRHAGRAGLEWVFRADTQKSDFGIAGVWYVRGVALGGLLDERPIFGRRELTMHFCFPHMS